MTPARLAAEIVGFMLLPAVAVGGATFAVLEWVARRQAERRLPELADEAESWVHALYGRPVA